MSPAEDAVQEKISVLKSFIDEHYYVCTKEILSGLGEMYVCDERFLKQIDRAGGDGTAAFVRQAISIYCAKSNTPQQAAATGRHACRLTDLRGDFAAV